CTFDPPTTNDCTAVGTYTANDFNFTNPPDTWLWSIEPPVSGVDLTDATLQTCTVTTTDSAVDVSFNLKVIATDSVSTDTANRTTTFEQTRLSAPIYVGPDPNPITVAQNIELGPFETAYLFTGQVDTYSLGGTWPTGIVIDADTGTLSGITLDAATDYPNCLVIATNIAGSGETTPITVTVTENEQAPVFMNGPIPDQTLLINVPIDNRDLRPTYFPTGTSPMTFTVDSGALPTGITLDPQTGWFQGIPSSLDLGDQGFVIVRCTNGAGTDVTNSFTWEVVDEILPVFWAVQPDLITTEVLGVLDGIGDLTEGNTSTRYYEDFEGIWRSFISAVPGYYGGRVVENLCLQSDDLETSWTLNSTTVTAGQTDPDGGATAFRVTATGSFARITQTDLTSVGDTVRGSWWVRRAVGTGGVLMRNGNGQGNYNITGVISSSWQRLA
ncbi:unnamed protein product, partial [marine sediment metagenome]